jgi:protease-4
VQAVRKFFGYATLVVAAVLVLVGLVAVVKLVGRRPLRTAEIAGIALIALVIIGRVVRALAPRVPKRTILELDLPTAPVEEGSQNKLAALAPRKTLTLGETIEALQRASRDKRVAGLIVRPRFDIASRAVIDELREAIGAFAATGKFTIAVADSFGEGGPANGAYTLATACQEITLQESGYVGLVPLSVEGNFYPDLLARAGVEMEVFGRGKYKSAPNRFTERKFTAPDREQLTDMLASFWDHTARTIAEARNLTPGIVAKLADKGPLNAQEALDEGLVDRVVFPDAAIAEAKKRAGAKASLLYLNHYKKRAGKDRQRGKAVTVAVIRAGGEIQRSSSGGLPIGLSGGGTMSPDALAPLIRAAADDKSVNAVVLRIDSPGGSALASDSIWLELMRLRDAGKPLVASMGTVAASGGYYIAAAADRIVAQPTTITGSIGVFGMRPIVAGAKKKLDVHTDEVHTGAEPSSFSVNRKASRVQQARINGDIDRIYELFRKRVADGRKLSDDAVLAVAEGRVWTGVDALDAGLVDELGGLDHALHLAVRLTDAAPGTRAKAKPFPKKTSGVGALRRKKPDSSEDNAVAASLLAGLPNLAALVPDGGVTIMAHLGFDPRSLWVK